VTTGWPSPCCAGKIQDRGIALPRAASGAAADRNAARRKPRRPPWTAAIWPASRKLSGARRMRPGRVHRRSLGAPSILVNTNIRAADVRQALESAHVEPRVVGTRSRRSLRGCLLQAIAIALLAAGTGRFLHRTLVARTAAPLLSRARPSPGRGVSFSA
jgi:hypothetical protein